MEYVRLRYLATFRNGFPFQSEGFNPLTGDPVIRIRDLRTQASVTRTEEPYPEWARVNNGDVLIGMDGDFNAVLWQGGPAALNQRVGALNARPEVLDQHYLAYAMPSV